MPERSDDTPEQHGWMDLVMGAILLCSGQQVTQCQQWNYSERYAKVRGRGAVKAYPGLGKLDPRGGLAGLWWQMPGYSIKLEAIPRDETILVSCLQNPSFFRQWPEARHLEMTLPGSARIYGLLGQDGEDRDFAGRYPEPPDGLSYDQVLLERWEDATAGIIELMRHYFAASATLTAGSRFRG